MIDARYAFPLLTTALTGQSALELVEKIPLEHLIHQGTLRLSMRTVRAIDEGGVAALVRVHFACRRAGARLELVDVRAAVTKVLERIGLAAELCPALEDSYRSQTPVLPPLN